MRIRALDATDDDAPAAWHAAYDAAHSFGLDHGSPRRVEEMRAKLVGGRVGDARPPHRRRSRTRPRHPGR